jgi:hypothetical protein
MLALFAQDKDPGVAGEMQSDGQGIFQAATGEEGTMPS